VADLPIRLADTGLQEQLGRVVDLEARIPRAIEALGPVNGLSVRMLDGDDGVRGAQLEELGARILPSEAEGAGGPADLTIAWWPMSRCLTGRADPPITDAAARVAELARMAGPTGRLIVIEDYGRDDVTPLIGGDERHRLVVAWSRRDGPFLTRGFKLRVLHCWWRWPSLEEARVFLGAAFGEAGASTASAMRSPRLAWNVALYHRTAEERRR
jgi:hypothetical protein